MADVLTEGEEAPGLRVQQQVLPAEEGEAAGLAARTWANLVWLGGRLLAANDWLGERIGNFVGLNDSHFQDAVDEYLRLHPEVTREDLHRYWATQRERREAEAAETGRRAPVLFAGSDLDDSELWEPHPGRYQSDDSQHDDFNSGDESGRDAEQQQQVEDSDDGDFSARTDDDVETD